MPPAARALSALSALFVALAAGCAPMAFLQDAEVVPTGEHRVGFGAYGGGGEVSSLYAYGTTFFWTRHGVAADALEVRTRMSLLPLGAAVGLKGALVGEPDRLGFHMALSGDLGVYYTPLFPGSDGPPDLDLNPDDDRTCGPDHGCPGPSSISYGTLEAALAFGARTSRDLSLWVTPRLSHGAVIGHPGSQTLVSTSVGVSGGRNWLVALELTPGYDVEAGEMVWFFAIGLEFPLGGR